MKKFLSTILACLLVAVGVFAMSGCEKDRDYNGIYKLSYACYLNNNKIEVYNMEDNPVTETYIKIEGQKVTEYVFRQSSGDVKDLISLTIPCTVLPEFYVTKEGNTEYFTNFTNLNRYIEGANSNKIERWTYVKVSSVPKISQNELVSHFGSYQLTEERRNGQIVANPTKVKLEVNGNLTFITGEGNNAETVVYTYSGVNNGIYMYNNNDVTMNLVVLSNGKLKTFTSNVDADKTYSEFSLIKAE